MRDEALILMTVFVLVLAGFFLDEWMRIRKCQCALLTKDTLEIREADNYWRKIPLETTRAVKSRHCLFATTCYQGVSDRIVIIELMLSNRTYVYTLTRGKGFFESPVAKETIQAIQTAIHNKHHSNDQ